MNQELTSVVFRKYKAGDIIALFPYDKEVNGFIGCYQQIGQHGQADYIAVIAQTKLATPAEYAELKAELEHLSPYPYKLRVLKKRASYYYRKRYL